MDNHRGAELTRGEIVINLYESLKAYGAFRDPKFLCLLAFIYISTFVLAFAYLRVRLPKALTFSSSIIAAFALTLSISIIAMMSKERISFVIYEKGILLRPKEGVEEFHPWKNFSYYSVAKDKVRIYFKDKSYLLLPKYVESFIAQKIPEKLDK